MNDTPPRGGIFTFKGWHLSKENRAAFTYECDVYGVFEESVDFPGAEGALKALAEENGRELLTLLGVAMGVSTYKLAGARTLRLPPLTPAGAAMAKALYTEGLAEFYVRSDLPYPPDLTIESEIVPTKFFKDDRPAGPALVAFGGGKDSYVARAILEKAGEEVQLTSVVLGEAVRTALRATAPGDLFFIDRRLDPKLYEVAPAAFGGHVPITAINMLILAVTALLNGQGSVVFANERSADEPTMSLEDGTTANHQYSKSSAFEALVNAATREAHPAPPPIYSILRPYSELWIGRAFSTLKDAFGRFTSCNRNFRLAGDADKRWCGACAKCAFTSLILSPFISREEAEEIFGGIFLDSESLQPFYRQLLGLADQKPWDCVGTIEECRAALWGASRGDFTETLAVRSFLPMLLAEQGESELAAAWDRAMAPDDNVSMDPNLRRAAAELSA